MTWVNQQGEEKKHTFYDLSRLSNQVTNMFIKETANGNNFRAARGSPEIPVPEYAEGA